MIARRIRAAREAGRLRPSGSRDRPGHAPTSKTFRRCRSTSSTSTSSPRIAASMATPTSCTVYNTEAEFVPWNACCRRIESTQIFSIESGPNARPCPGQVRPFNPRLEAGTSSSVAGAHSCLRPEARPRRRRPVPRRSQLQDASGLHRQPARDLLLPGGLDRRGCPEGSAGPSRRPRAARPPARSAPRTLPPAPAPIHSTRSARCIWQAPSRARRSRLGRDHAGLGRPL